MNKKFEFFLNAVHYCIYLGEIWSMKKVDNCVLRIMYYLSVLFSFENFYNKKVDERTIGGKTKCVKMNETLNQWKTL